MRLRDKTYRDYGFRHGEEKYIKQLAMQPGYEQRLLLYDSAYEANNALADDVIYSIISGVSYDEIIKIKYIPATRADFYGYCRATLALFREKIREYGAI